MITRWSGHPLNKAHSVRRDTLASTESSDAFVGGGFDAQAFRRELEGPREGCLDQGQVRCENGGFRNDDGVNIDDGVKALSRSPGAFFEDHL